MPLHTSSNASIFRPWRRRRMNFARNWSHAGSAGNWFRHTVTQETHAHAHKKMITRRNTQLNKNERCAHTDSKGTLSFITFSARSRGADAKSDNSSLEAKISSSRSETSTCDFFLAARALTAGGDATLDSNVLRARYNTVSGRKVVVN